MVEEYFHVMNFVLWAFLTLKKKQKNINTINKIVLPHFYLLWVEFWGTVYLVLHQTVVPLEAGEGAEGHSTLLADKLSQMTLPFAVWTNNTVQAGRSAVAQSLGIDDQLVVCQYQPVWGVFCPPAFPVGDTWLVAIKKRVYNPQSKLFSIDTANTQGLPDHYGVAEAHFKKVGEHLLAPLCWPL